MTDENRYSVETRTDERGWEAVILDPSGAEVLHRACASREEAETFASSVRRHIAWLSPSRFRTYYRLPDPG